MSCFEKCCRDDVVVKCLCSKIPIFSCKNHMNFHMLTKTEKPHNYEQIVLNVSMEKKIELTKRIMEAIEDLQDFQKDVLKTVSTFVNEITVNTYKIESEIIQTISTLKAYTRKIMSSVEYPTNDYFGKILHDNINLSQESKLWRVSNIFKTLEENNIIKFKSCSHEIYKRLKDSSEFLLGKTNKSNANNVFCLCEKIKNKNYIIKLDLTNHKIEQMPILLKNIVFLPIVCGLPDNKLFIGGGKIDDDHHLNM
ncbi:hypothetical protein SteCoe_26494 [Stentor coeruleus]|uniref:Uncharacterized protein n=1 Tax=Stentor coeruleus TaxID=5963 RepID=A0A1R2BCQ2_9CILI|nr:hypothetical protein SteCoe_26494 [Stentor coeruleus]